MAEWLSDEDLGTGRGFEFKIFRSLEEEHDGGSQVEVPKRLPLLDTDSLPAPVLRTEIFISVESRIVAFSSVGYKLLRNKIS